MPNHSDFRFHYAIDLGKNVSQVFFSDTTTGEVSNVSVYRDQLLDHFRNHDHCLIGMEACSSSQYWARELIKLGHTVVLMDPKAVKPYVRGNKSDKADAEGIYRAMTYGVRSVTVKSQLILDIQTLLTMRRLMLSQRTAGINHVRGILMEYGYVMPKTVSKFQKQVDACVAALEGVVTQLVVETLRETLSRLRDLEQRQQLLLAETVKLAKQTRNAGNLLTVPGIGPVTMAHLVVLLDDPAAFRSAREFAAYLGLVPMHTGSGGKTITTHIPGRCDQRMRALMVECAQSVARSKHKEPWVVKILQTKPKKVALIAIANRLARQCWAVASKGQPWRRMPSPTAQLGEP